MKIICIDSSISEGIDFGRASGLTFGKIYESLPYEGLTKETHYQLINDRGKLYNYLKTRFKTIDQVREEKLNNILK